MIANVLYSLPSWVAAVLLTGLVLLFALAGQLVVHRAVPADERRRHNDLTGPISALVGIVFAVLIAFVAVAVWQQFDATDRNVVLEASAVSDLYRQAFGYPEPLRSKVRQSARTYLDVVINEEWPLQRRGKFSVTAWQTLEAAHRDMLVFEPTSEGETLVHREQLAKMSEVMALRRARIYAINQGIAPQVWTVMIIGIGLMIAMSWFFGADSLRVHLALTTCLAVSIGLALYLIAGLDYPLRGDLAVTSEAFESVRANLTRLTSDEATDATSKR